MWIEHAVVNDPAGIETAMVKSSNTNQSEWHSDPQNTVSERRKTSRRIGSMCGASISSYEQHGAEGMGGLDRDKSECDCEERQDRQGRIEVGASKRE